MKIPSSHQSTGAECPAPERTSGLKYSSVPTKEFVNANGSAIRTGFCVPDLNFGGFESEADFLLLFFFVSLAAAAAAISAAGDGEELFLHARPGYYCSVSSFR